MIVGEMDAARAALATLTEQTAQVQASADNQADGLAQGQRAALSGQATLKQVSDLQGRHEAAQGLLSLHLYDVEQAAARVADLERAAKTKDRLAEARDLARLMHEAKTDFDAIAAQAEADLARVLSDLEAKRDLRARTVAQLARLTREAVNEAHGSTGGLTIGARLPVTPSPERLTASAFLAAIDPELAEHEVFGFAGLGVPDGVYPLLSRVAPR